MNLPRITIITPSFNQGQYIEETIQSVLNQNYPNLEYIIIDGGSTDNTVDIIKKYEDNISYWVSEPDYGQAHAINKGLERIKKTLISELTTHDSEGHLVNWINSDDYLEPEALTAIANAWQRNPEGEIFCGFTRCFWDHDNSTSHRYRMGIKKNSTSTLLNIEMNQPGTFYSANVLQKLDKVNESLRYVFDNELWMRYLCRFGQKNVVLLNDTIAHFRQHGNSKSFGEGFDAFNDEQQNILQHLCLQTQLPDYLQTYVNRDTHNHNYQSANWDVNHLNIKAFHASFANKYMISLLNDGLKKESKQAFKTVIKAGKVKWDRKTLGLIRKLI